MVYKSKYLICELSEFNLQRFGESPTAQATNPELSLGSFDRHLDNIKMSNIRLNNILNNVRSTNNIYDIKRDRVIDGLDITNLKILRMIPNNEIDLDIYITFDLDDKNYHGVIKNFITNPNVKSEVFRDNNLFVNKEWIIKTKGNLIKVIRNWMNISPSKWLSLKDIDSINTITGDLFTIKKGTLIKVVRTLDNNTIVISVNDNNYILKNKNFFYFNYWFEKI